MIKLNAYASLNEEQRVELALDIISFNEGNSEGLKRKNNDGNKELSPDFTDNTVSNAGKQMKNIYFFALGLQEIIQNVIVLEGLKGLPSVALECLASIKLANLGTAENPICIDDYLDNSRKSNAKKDYKNMAISSHKKRKIYSDVEEKKQKNKESLPAAENKTLMTAFSKNVLSTASFSSKKIALNDIKLSGAPVQPILLTSTCKTDLETLASQNSNFTSVGDDLIKNFLKEMNDEENSTEKQLNIYSRAEELNSLLKNHVDNGETQITETINEVNALSEDLENDFKKTEKTKFLKRYIWYRLMQAKLVFAADSNARNEIQKAMEKVVDYDKWNKACVNLYIFMKHLGLGPSMVQNATSTNGFSKLFKESLVLKKPITSQGNEKLTPVHLALYVAFGLPRGFAMKQNHSERYNYLDLLPLYDDPFQQLATSWMSLGNSLMIQHQNAPNDNDPKSLLIACKSSENDINNFFVAGGTTYEELEYMLDKNRISVQLDNYICR